MNKLTNGYAPSTEDCKTYLVMLSNFAFLEKDTHEHVHKEHQILLLCILRECS
jgi:iron-sulfur cluster repair protein YtfE (RIC family)